MTEEQMNHNYIEERLSRVAPAYVLKRQLLEEVRKMLVEAYLEGKYGSGRKLEK